MLMQETIQACVPLADLLDADRVRITPVQQSPLADVVEASNITSVMAAKTPLEDSDLVNNAVAVMQTLSASKDDTLGYAPHSEVLNKIRGVVRDSIAGTLNFARNTVAPVVGDLVENVTARVQQTVFDSVNRMQVVIDEIPQPLLNGQLAQMLELYRGQTFLQPKLAMRGPELHGSDITDLLVTGSASIDSDIKYWAATKGDAYFQNLWDTVFRIRQNGFIDNGQSENLSSLFPHSVPGMENALAVFLISNRLINSPLEGFEMPLSVYEDLMASFRQAAAAVLIYEIEALDQEERVGLLVRDYSKTTVTVNSSVYSKWISEGGDNEVLFGNLLGKEVYRTVDEINDHATELKLAWTRYATMLTISEQAKKNLRIRESLSAAFRDQVQALADDDPTVLSNVMTVYDRFNSELSKTPDSDFNDLYSVALRLVCRSRFPNTDAERILSDVARYGRENPELPPREAAAIATLMYLIDWVATQFVIEKF